MDILVGVFVVGFGGDRAGLPWRPGKFGPTGVWDQGIGMEGSLRKLGEPVDSI